MKLELEKDSQEDLKSEEPDIIDSDAKPSSHGSSFKSMIKKIPMSMLTKSHLVPNVKLPSFVKKWNPFGSKKLKKVKCQSIKLEKNQDFSDQFEFEEEFNKENNQDHQKDIKGSLIYQDQNFNNNDSLQGSQEINTSSTADESKNKT